MSLTAAGPSRRVRITGAELARLGGSGSAAVATLTGQTADENPVRPAATLTLRSPGCATCRSRPRPNSGTDVGMDAVPQAAERGRAPWWICSVTRSGPTSDRLPAERG